MHSVHVIWDLEDDPDGNTRHILDGHDVTLDEVEEILRSPASSAGISRSSGNSMMYGWTSTGKYIAVVFEVVLEDPYMVYPITAYPVPAPRE
jgi:hypothetical protein